MKVGIEDSAAKTDVARQLDPMEKVLVLLVGFTEG